MPPTPAPRRRSSERRETECQHGAISISCQTIKANATSRSLRVPCRGIERGRFLAAPSPSEARLLLGRPDVLFCFYGVSGRDVRDISQADRLRGVLRIGQLSPCWRRQSNTVRCPVCSLFMHS